MSPEYAQNKPYSSRCAKTGSKAYSIKTDKNLVWIFDDSVDTTLSGTNCAYDRMIMTKLMENYFIGRKGIVEVSDEVSDHHLIWAVFKVD